MKTLASAAVLAALLALALPAGAQQEPQTVTGYLVPSACFGTRMVNITLCPTAWVAMERVESDSLHTEVWYCVDLDHTCFTAGAGCGCSGGKLYGWKLTATPATDLRAEIEAKVIDPCIRSLVRGGVGSMSEDEAVALGRQSQEAAWEDTITKIATAVDGQTQAYRSLIYKAALVQCETMLDK